MGQSQQAAFEERIQPTLNQACVHCHGPDVEEGNLRIDTLNPDLVQGADVKWWLEVLAVLNNGEMPPPDESELTDDDRSQVVQWLARELQRASSLRRATEGHSSFRRMTRYEYNYALQDILGLPRDFAKDLPPEAHSADGFQNSSEMLHMSVMQFDTYRQIARQALARATVLPAPAQGALGEGPAVLYWGISMEDAARREWRQQEKKLAEVRKEFKEDPAQLEVELERLTASFKSSHNKPYYRELSTGRTALATWAYQGAKYAFEPSASPAVMPTAFDHVAVIPDGRNQKLIVELGDQVPDQGIMRVRVRASRTSKEGTRAPSLQLEFGWRASNEGRADVRVSTADIPVRATPDSPEVYQWDVPLGDIYPRNSVRKISQMGEIPSPSEYIRLVNSTASQGDLQIDYVEVIAPFYEQWPPPSHSQIFIDSENRENEAAYAREVLAAFMPRAWRRRITQADIDQKIRLFEGMREECASFEEAMVEVLASVLSSPHFLYVVQEETPSEIEQRKAETAGDPELVSQTELATRLSMFLWSSVPDTQLLELAFDGQLSDAEVLAGQVDRMLADPRSQRFAKHFVRQWLDMQLLDFLSVDSKTSRLDPQLKEAMQLEPIVFFQEVLRNNESVLNFIHTDYAMLNERLAQHYGLSDVYGNHFRRVNFEPSARRGGLLTQAGLLAMNSDGVDSHPLKRGVWLLESLLNDPPPPPPPAVPEIDLADPEIAKLSLKERIEDHRNHAACMSCHAKIDPWGIAFENYDALGRWRDDIDGQPVDASSLLFNKQELDGMDGLKRFLLEHRRDQFVRALVYKLATYALGRPLTFSDYARIDQVTSDAREEGEGLATMIQLLVASDLFRSR
ncbi:Planctomycete cytochrome C [Aureliella helgolandensis]|uniref:Planctomycete cytochrome C n=2 Tax=Aureliella helgolandensis TaxID=2527968 RepID=A0A518GD92_9BACT|nr:Planctomycete cytochrome C [Aureliella helgolandensis]